MTDTVPTSLEAWTAADTAGWLLVTPEMRSTTDTFDRLPSRASNDQNLWMSLGEAA
ncbi:hypothetical protein MTY66_62360 (plasmid) [Mycolicibacterium sp. TY66]|uniref:hypothetical protein n=1 Tax=unclassified Mycolicibacterium TaxID=2636767 RepID=UPI001BB452E9|nr:MULTISPECIES: hypothetical protein [unclassified Mycolicibacterium]BCI84611.1 hypothetical protein MTY66_62360 [Mycolicibacterium sp. TY66]BCJ84841.1 hypothetical protein MTY81_62140 [Mycolicibacterium sp. TY81]